jgi:hypothetical protein
MRVKLGWAGESGECTPTPFTDSLPFSFITFTITSKVAVYAPAEWADTLTLFHLLYRYVLCGLLYSVRETGVGGRDAFSLFPGSSFSGHITLNIDSPWKLLAPKTACFIFVIETKTSLVIISGPTTH